MAQDLIVIGGGPAGMTAAAIAAEHGADVLLLDDQAALGGQIYRGIERSDEVSRKVLGEEYAAGKDICRWFLASGARYNPGSVVWQVTDGRQIAYSDASGSRLVDADAIVLATGAIERPFPIPGWTLPGVMTAGAAQTMLKASGMVADGAVFAGTGPLLYLVAAQYLRAGVKIGAVLETTAPNPVLRSAIHLPMALLRGDLLLKGRRWLDELRRGGTTVVSGVSDLAISGDGACERVSYRTESSDWQSITADHVFLHQGVVPNVNLSMSIGLTHVWDKGQLCWRPNTDRWGHASVEGIFVCGDGAGIDGASAAAAAGEVTALAVLARLGVLSDDVRNQRSAGAFAKLRKEGLVRPFLDAWFRPPQHFRIPRDDETLVCRCEEVSRGEVMQAARTGVAGPNQLKAFTRAGMGPCQGRFCGLTIQALIAQARGKSPEEVGYYRLRPPIKPVKLADIAGLEIAPSARVAAE